MVIPRRVYLGLLAILCATAFIYLPVIGFDYVNFDDGSFVGPFTNGQDLYPYLTQFQAYDYIPITWLSFWFESLFVEGMNPSLSHGVNLALHLVNIGLLFYLLSRFLSPLWSVILIATALFALHPMNVESVVWVTERKGLLSTMFVLISCIFYFRRLVQDEQMDRRVFMTLSWAWIFYFFAVLAKPVAIVLPAVFLIFDYIVWRKTSWKKTFLEKLPFFMVAIVFAFVHFYARHSDIIMNAVPTTSLDAAKTLLNSFFFYPAQFLLPQELRVFYSQYTVGAFRALLIVALVLLGTLYYLRNLGYKREIFGGVLLYLIFILPQTKIIPYGLPFIHADRYFYLAGVGLIMSFVMLVQVTRRLKRYGAYLSWMFVLPVGMACLQTPSQIQAWKNSATLWERVIQFEPRLMTARNNLGLYWLDNDIVKASLIFEQIVKMDPTFAKAWMNLAHIAEKRGDLPLALQIIETGLKYAPGDQALNETATVLRQVIKK